MRKTLVILMMAFSINSAMAQLDLNKAKQAASSVGLDVNALTKNIMSTLTSKLKLADTQTSKLTDLVGKFLTNKSGFASLMQSKPDEYKTKFDGEQKTLFSGLKGALKPEQFTQFMNLKPKTNDATNALSQLFF